MFKLPFLTDSGVRFSRQSIINVDSILNSTVGAIPHICCYGLNRFLWAGLETQLHL